MADDRTYIRVHDGMPDHPKIDALSDRAFRLLVTSWCWCSRHLTDGRIPLAVWNKRGTPASRKELVASGLIEVPEHADFVTMHDYLEHQRSADEVAAMRAQKAAAGKKGAESRWGKAPAMTPAIAPAKQVSWQNDGEAMASTETETDIASNEAIGGRAKRAHQLPETWQPSEPHRTFAAQKSLDLGHEVAQFADHHRARGNAMKDWDRAFWTWLRNSAKWSREPEPTRAVSRLPYAHEIETPPDGLSEAEYSAWMREAAARRKAGQ